MAIRAVANDHNKSTGLQFRMPKLVSCAACVAARGGVALASGNSHAPNVMFACANPNSALYANLEEGERGMNYVSNKLLQTLQEAMFPHPHTR